MHQCFLRELNKEGVLLVQWIPGPLNGTDLFTKNLPVPMFEIFLVSYLVGVSTTLLLKKEGVISQPVRELIVGTKFAGMTP